MNNGDSSSKSLSKWGCDTNFWRKEGWGQQHVLSTCGNHARDRLPTCWSAQRSPHHKHTLLSCQQPQFSLAQNLSRDLSRLQQSSTPKLSPTSSPLSIKGSASVVHLRIEATPVLTFNSDLLRICMDLFIWQNLSPKRGLESDDGGRSLKQGQSVLSVRLWGLHQQPQHLNLSEGKTESWNRKNKKEVSPT